VESTAWSGDPAIAFRANPDLGCTTYAGDMSTQIAVRLPDEVVAFLDRAVASGSAPSRAAVVTAALERHMRLQAAQMDVDVLHQHGATDDLDPLVRWSVPHADVVD